MQPIERYGLVALLFLVVTVVAVVLWDKKSDKDKAKLAQTAPGTTLVQPQPGAPELGSAQPTAPLGAPGKDLAQPTLAPAPAPNPTQAPTSVTTPTLIADPQDAFATHAPASAAAATTYQVKRGDTLSSIAKSALGAASRYPEILALNPGLDPNRMKIGQTIALPNSSDARAVLASAPSTASASKLSAPGTSYKVRRGDSLWTIAQAQLGDGDRYTEIAALNPRIDPQRLVVGTELRLPATSTRPARVADKRPAVAANTSRRGGVL
jgi:nucleoid-associated protein YgaU